MQHAEQYLAMAKMEVKLSTTIRVNNFWARPKSTQLLTQHTSSNEFLSLLGKYPVAQKIKYRVFAQ